MRGGVVGVWKGGGGLGLLNVVCLLSGGAVEEEGGVVWGFLWGGRGGVEIHIQNIFMERWSEAIICERLFGEPTQLPPMPT